MGELTPSDVGRGRLWIVVGLSLTALAIVMFGLIWAADDSSGEAVQSSPLPQSTSRTSLPAAQPSPASPTRDNGLVDAPSATSGEASPTTATDAATQSATQEVTAEQVPTTVTVTAPPTAAPGDGSFFNSAAATIAAITTFVIALTGLVTAATGFVKLFRKPDASAKAS
jgi:cytoskeletal protein RodZ